jgi:hypothetical protein
MQQAAADREKGKAAMSTKLDVPFDTDTEEGSKSPELLPEGKYRAEIFVGSCGPTKNQRGLMVSLTWQVVEGQYAQRNLFQNILLEHESEKARTIGRGMFKDICSCCGLTGPVDDLEALYFKPCAISVKVEKDRNGEYPDKNRIVRVYPVGALATPEQVRQQQADALREASTPKASFKATDEDMSDTIPF